MFLKINLFRNPLLSRISRQAEWISLVYWLIAIKSRGNGHRPHSYFVPIWIYSLADTILGFGKVSMHNTSH